MKKTLSELSQKTGYSIATISRVLSGKATESRIPAETANAILKAAQDNGFFPNIVAQNLRSHKVESIGLLLPSISNPFFADIANAVIASARKNHYTTIVVDSNENEDEEKHALSSLLSQKVKGIIAIPTGKDSALYEEIARKYMPVVLVDRYFMDSFLPYVTTNNYTGAFNVTTHLIQNGHRRIACIQGAQSSVPNARRVKGYMDALQKAGIQDNAIVMGDAFSVQNGFVETQMLLSMKNRPTAIFALSNTIMLGAIKTLRESGVRIPDDISIVCFDDNTYMDYLTPPITRVGQKTEEMGKLAVKILMESMSTGVCSRTQIELESSLINGKSVGII